MYEDEMKWSASEKKIARAAFVAALQREFQEVQNLVRQMAVRTKDVQDVWKLEVYIRERRTQINKKYDYRYSRLIDVFAILYAEKYLLDEDMEGLSPDKLELIRRFAKSYAS